MKTKTVGQRGWSNYLKLCQARGRRERLGRMTLRLAVAVSRNFSAAMERD